MGINMSLGKDEDISYVENHAYDRIVMHYDVNRPNLGPYEFSRALKNEEELANFSEEFDIKDINKRYFSFGINVLEIVIGRYDQELVENILKAGAKIDNENHIVHLLSNIRDESSLESYKDNLLNILNIFKMLIVCGFNYEFYRKIPYWKKIDIINTKTETEKEEIAKIRAKYELQEEFFYLTWIDERHAEIEEEIEVIEKFEQGKYEPNSEYDRVQRKFLSRIEDHILKTSEDIRNFLIVRSHKSNFNLFSQNIISNNIFKFLVEDSKDLNYITDLNIDVSISEIFAKPIKEVFARVGREDLATRNR